MPRTTLNYSCARCRMVRAASLRLVHQISRSSQGEHSDTANVFGRQLEKRSSEKAKEYNFRNRQLWNCVFEVVCAADCIKVE